LKTGTQVLAFDQLLNPDIKDPDKLSIENQALIQEPSSILPPEWVGSKPYKSKAYYEGKQVDIIMVPFADAGQTGGEVRVWIKKSN